MDPLPIFCFGRMLHTRTEYHTGDEYGPLVGFRKTLPLMTGMTAGLFAVMMLNVVGNLFIGATSQKVLRNSD